MSYSAPPSSFHEISYKVPGTSTEVVLEAVTGEQALVRFLGGVGWELELRYDLSSSGYRQPYTGAQSELQPLPISVREDSSYIECAVAGDILQIHRSSARIALIRNGATRFLSDAAPFGRHQAPVELFEGIMSLKVTDLSDRTHLPVRGQRFSTSQVRFSYPLPLGPILGLPGQTGELNRSGYRFELYNTDEFTHTPARRPMYQSWPILFHRDESASGWIGLFHDNPSRTFVDLGDFYPNSITFESITGNTRLYILTDDTLLSVSERMSRLLGRMPMPPAWAFGYQQCRWSYMSTDAVRELVAQFKVHGIPLDAVYFDIDYMDEFRVFTTHRKYFTDLRPCLDDLHDSGIHAVCIVDPGVKADPGYEVYNRVLASGAILKEASGEPFLMRCWAETSVLPDFGSETMQATWRDLQNEWLTRYPFDGIWNDMNEPSNFDGGNPRTAQAWTERGPLAQEYNLYGYHMARASRAGWNAFAPDRKGLVITRAGYPGVQQHAVIWHGDNCAWWEHLRLALHTALQYSIAGAFFTGADLPGFTGNPPDDLAVRFFQLGAFLPLFRGHSIYFARDKEPYAFSETARRLIKEAITLRYSLISEWIEGFEAAISNSRSPMNPVFTNRGTLVQDQVVLFNKLLVAPIVSRDAEERSLYLPPGRWYELGRTAGAIEGDRWITIPCSLASIPCFVRAGTSLKRNTVAETVERSVAGPIATEIYPR